MKKLDVSKISALCALVLGLEYQTKVRVYRRHIPGIHESCGGHWIKKQGGSFCHRIALSIEFCLYNEAVRGFNEVIAHEFVHAYVSENHPKATHHGRTFQRKAAALRRSLRSLGVNVAPLYLKGIDV